MSSMMPIRPPTVNSKLKPSAQSIAGNHLMLTPRRVTKQINTFTPVGIAIIIVADVNYAYVSTSMPTINM